MWVSPRYREITGSDPPSTAQTCDDPGLAAPEDRGERLATIPRSSRGAEEELRVSVAEYQGHKFLSLRVWQRDDRGAFWPVKGKGLSVRLSEAEAVAKALIKGRRIAVPPAQASAAAGARRSPARGPARGQQEFPPERAAGGNTFDEF